MTRRATAGADGEVRCWTLRGASSTPRWSRSISSPPSDGRMTGEVYTQVMLSVPTRLRYDSGVKQIICVCGVILVGKDDDELWANAQKHMRTDHPDLVGKVRREDLLAQAEER